MNDLDDILPDIESGVEELLDTLNSIDSKLDKISNNLDKTNKD